MASDLLGCTWAKPNDLSTLPANGKTNKGEYVPQDEEKVVDDFTH